VIRAHQPGSEPIDIPETIPNPVVLPKPTPNPREPAPKEPVRTPEKVPSAQRRPLAARAQQSVMPAIGFLSSGSPLPTAKFGRPVSQGVSQFGYRANPGISRAKPRNECHEAWQASAGRCPDFGTLQF